MNMTKEPEEVTRKNDVLVSWILAATWLGGVILVRTLHDDIPFMMLVIGTVFFFVLIPAMKEIARSLDRFFTHHFSDKIN